MPFRIPVKFSRFIFLTPSLSIGDCATLHLFRDFVKFSKKCNFAVIRAKKCQLIGTLVKSRKTPALTADLLDKYSKAALSNAEELLKEASLLLDHNHMARAYFLAVSCIEEAGKALQAFDGQHRNLSDPAVCNRLVAGLENHGQKINYALSIWALNGSDPRGALRVALDLIGQLKRGREPSMYSDLRTEPNRAQTPREIIRTEAARDCVKLAEHCLAYTHRNLHEKTPAKSTSAQDRLFTMKSAKFQDMLNREDFWWYFIGRIESGNQDLAEAVFSYERDHIKTERPFTSSDDAK